MAGIQLTLDEIVALMNEELPPDQPELNDGTIMDHIYGGAVGEAAAVAAEHRVTAPQLVTLINRVLNNNNLVPGFARIAGIRTNEFISELINSHNPYTTDNMTDMNIYTGNPDFSQWADNKTNQIEVEVDGPYTMPKEWYFKGLPQHINKALRIKYRYKAVNLGERPQRAQIKPDHWITAYMLIGYEDGGA
jgi:hypothetical protein